jgi:hypothetical protein
VNDLARRHRLINVTLIVIFSLVLCAPVAEQRFPLIGVTPVVELRQKAPLPAGNPVQELWSNPSYFEEYERHVNDTFGFRDFFIRLRNQIQYSLFGDSNQVVLGDDGWLADKSSLEVQQPAVDQLTDTQWTRLADRMLRFQGILEKRGIKLFVIPIPLKNTVYPELSPVYTAQRPVVTGYERFRRLLVENRLPFVDTFAVLTDKKRSYPVYYKTDMHWNMYGAASVAAETVNELGREMHRDVHWRYQNRVVIQPMKGGVENAVLATFWPLPDNAPTVLDRSDDCGKTVFRGAYAISVNRCSSKTLPATMMIGNSFMLTMAAAGFQTHFSTLYRTSDLLNFSRVLSMIPPGTKILIWQLFELEIGYQLQSDAWWNEIDRWPETQSHS